MTEKLSTKQIIHNLFAAYVDNLYSHYILVHCASNANTFLQMCGLWTFLSFLNMEYRDNFLSTPLFFACKTLMAIVLQWLL